MEIKTKFNIGDFAYFIYEDEIVKHQINKITISCNELYTNIEYIFIIEPATSLMDDGITTVRNETKCFKTIEEMINYHNKFNS